MRFAAEHRLPLAGGWGAWAQRGGLMSYGPNINDMVRRAVSYVDRILKGAKPADLPVQQRTKFELVINLIQQSGNYVDDAMAYGQIAERLGPRYGQTGEPCPCG